MLKLYDFAMSMPFPEEWLAARKGDYRFGAAGEEEQELLALPWAALFMEHTRYALQGCMDKLEAALRLCEEPDGPYFYGALLEREREMVARLLGLCGGGEAKEETEAAKAAGDAPGSSEKERRFDGTADYDSLCAAFGAVAFDRLPSKRDTSVSQTKREAAKSLRDGVKIGRASCRERVF